MPAFMQGIHSPSACSPSAASCVSGKHCFTRRSLQAHRINGEETIYVIARFWLPYMRASMLTIFLVLPIASEPAPTELVHRDNQPNNAVVRPQAMLALRGVGTARALVSHKMTRSLPSGGHANHENSGACKHIAQLLHMRCKVHENPYTSHYLFSFCTKSSVGVA